MSAAEPSLEPGAAGRAPGADPPARSSDRAPGQLGGQLAEVVAGLVQLGPHPRADGLGRGYGEIINALGVAVYITDARGRITFFNEAAARLWGRRPSLGEEWCGSLRLFWPDGRPMRHEECPMAVALRQGRPAHGGEATAERPDGTRVAFVAYPTPLVDDADTMIGAVNVLVDLTRQRAAEDALRTAARALEASNAVKDEFLGLVSHELRTPLTTIFGNARLLQDRFERLTEEDRRSMVGDIAEDSERLLGIVENLLLLTRLGPGAVADLEPKVIGQSVGLAIRSFRRGHPDRVVRLLGEPSRLVVEADDAWLDRMLANVLANADTYSPPGATIDVEVERADGEVRVRVLDRGIGLGDAQADDLFTAFYRGPSARRTTDGVGIGLAVVRRLAELQSGRVWAVSRVGGGAEIGFALPSLAAGDAETAADVLRSGSRDGSRDGSRTVHSGGTLV